MCDRVHTNRGLVELTRVKTRDFQNESNNENKIEVVKNESKITLE